MTVNFEVGNCIANLVRGYRYSIDKHVFDCLSNKGCSCCVLGINDVIGDFDLYAPWCYSRIITISFFKLLEEKSS